MTSPDAIQCGNYYHIFSRGVNRENIFIEDRNYHLFLNLYIKYCGPIVDTFAYCLLRNHFHLFVRIKTKAEIMVLSAKDTINTLANETSPSHQFSVFLNAYSKTINKAYHRTGSLFQHPFGRVLITNHDYFNNLICYIHQNPQHHGFAKDFREWPFSSYHVYLANQETFVNRKIILEYFRNSIGYKESHTEKLNLNSIKPLISNDFF